MCVLFLDYLVYSNVVDVFYYFHKYSYIVEPIEGILRKPLG